VLGAAGRLCVPPPSCVGHASIACLIGFSPRMRFLSDGTPTRCAQRSRLSLCPLSSCSARSTQQHRHTINSMPRNGQTYQDNGGRTVKSACARNGLTCTDRGSRGRRGTFTELDDTGTRVGGIWRRRAGQSGAWPSGARQPPRRTRPESRMQRGCAARASGPAQS
jgi:hypothetical protein